MLPSLLSLLTMATRLNYFDVAEGELETLRAAVKAGAALGVPVSQAELGSAGASLPLSVAASHGRREVVELLLQAGAKAELEDPGSRRSAISHAFDFVDPTTFDERTGLAALLLERSGPMAPALVEGAFARLCLAVQNAGAVGEGQLALATALVKRGLEVRQPFVRQLTHEAAREASAATLTLLAHVEAPLDLESEELDSFDVDGRTWGGAQFASTLDQVRQAGPREAAVAALAVITAQPLPAERRPAAVDGPTLVAAARTGGPGLVRYLMAKGAPTTAADAEGRTVRFVAEERALVAPDDVLAEAVRAELAAVPLGEGEEAALERRRAELAAEREAQRQREEAEGQARLAQAQAERARERAIDRALLLGAALLWLALLLLGLLARETALSSTGLWQVARALSLWAGPPLAGAWGAVVLWVGLDAAFPDRAMHSYFHIGAGFVLGLVLAPVAFVALTAALGRLFWLMRADFGQVRAWYYLAYVLFGAVVPLAWWLRR